MTLRKFTDSGENYLDDGTLGALNATSDFIEIRGDFLLEIGGTFSGTVELQSCRGSADDTATEANWTTVSRNTTGDAATFTGSANMRGHEDLSNMWYRLKCTAYTSGTIEYKLGGS